MDQIHGPKLFPKNQSPISEARFLWFKIIENHLNPGEPEKPVISQIQQESLEEKKLFQIAFLGKSTSGKDENRLLQAVDDLLFDHTKNT